MNAPRMSEEAFTAHQRRVNADVAKLAKARANGPTGKPARPDSDPRTEHQIQCSFIDRLKLYENRYPDLQLGFAIPNAGAGASRGQAGKMRGEGVRAGVPDWHLPVRSGGHIGLWIEFKSAQGRVSDAQVAYANKLFRAGHLVYVCNSDIYAFGIVMNYIGAKVNE